jgi:crotonobetainyl-CoA:carnitine CoA-transferase CaiB-like acyl-CoA transferase
VGEHNEEILGGLLGYSQDEIAKMYATGVISSSHHYDALSG